jgi:hypothetical protein
MSPAKGVRKNDGATCARSSDSKRLKQSPCSWHDDGLPVVDEILLAIFACSVLKVDDLVRCGATCRRWFRLVTSEAGFISRHKASPSDRGRSAALAVGFVHQMQVQQDRGPPRLIPLAPSRFPGALKMDKLFDDGVGAMFRSARVVASRNGRLVLELRRWSRAAALRLAVVNPMTRNARVLPVLSKEDKPGGCYACAVLTDGDNLGPQHARAADRRAWTRSAFAFEVILLYARSKSTPCRFYSSATRAWSPERLVSGATLSGKRLRQMQTNGATVSDGGAMYWRANEAVVALRMDTLEATLMPLPLHRSRLYQNQQYLKNSLVTAWRDGRPCVVQARSCEEWLQLRVLLPDESGGGGSRWKEARNVCCWATGCSCCRCARRAGSCCS